MNTEQIDALYVLNDAITEISFNYTLETQDMEARFMKIMGLSYAIKCVLDKE